MPIAITGTGTITGISAGGLPDGCITTAELAQPLTLATAQASTSGTAIDFTGIPSWAKKITVMLNGVSTNGTNILLFQLGSGSVTFSGYSAVGSAIGASSVASVQYTAGFGVGDSNASARTKNGNGIFSNISSNNWTGSGIFADSSSARSDLFSGSISLSGALDRIRITTNSADAFDAGSVNIMYEG